MSASALIRRLVGFLLLASGVAVAQRGAVTIGRNLADLVAQSAVIVRGYVNEARVEPHPQLTHLQTVVVTLRVEETLKGKPGMTFTFRQYIWDLRDVKDAAGYRKGQEFLLLMNAPTAYGLSSPAGLGQGRFRIVNDASGAAVVANERGNQGLFSKLDSQLKVQGVQLAPRLQTVISRTVAGPLRLDDMRELIRSMVPAK